jgi:murein DD-endopeptidase MepM/ murein hydrolase activator NlpD
VETISRWIAVVRAVLRGLFISLRQGLSRGVKKPSYWTIQVFPEGSGRSHSYRLRPRFLHLTILVALAMVGLSSAWVLGFLGHRHAISELNRYKAENQHLVSNLEQMGEQTRRLTTALDDLAARDQRFRVVAGLPLVDEEVYSAGVGGPMPEDPGQEQFYRLAPDLADASRGVNASLDQLLRRAELLSTSLSEAVDSVETRADVYRRRPTIFPVQTKDSWISSSFSYNRLHPLLGYRRPHPGVDISAAAGSNVVATGAGTVTYAGNESGYGRLVEIDHGDGYVSRYAHLARVLVRVGQTVDRGTLLGEVGRSGLTTGPNLHYEILVNDRPVNPVGYLLDDSFRR